MAFFTAALQRAWLRRSFWLWLLLPLEWLYRGVAALRRAAYDSGLLPRYRAHVPVVVVGNITVGGTGKTPVVIALVEALRDRGIVAGVVSRGYGAAVGRHPAIVTNESDPARCGDEPLLIHQRTGCPCVVAPARSRAVRELLRAFRVDVVICDDGLQHYALERDVEIVLYDTADPMMDGRCLPVGPLREPPERITSVDYVLAGGSDDRDFGVMYVAGPLVNLVSGQSRAPDPDTIGREVYAVAGIARPERFFELLRGFGFRLRESALPDHHRFRRRDLEFPDAAPVIMTGKDAVKCRALAGDDAWYLSIDAVLPIRLIDRVAAIARRA